MTRPDLDAIQARAENAKVAYSHFPADCTNNCYDGPCDCSGVTVPMAWDYNAKSDVLALVVELRAARAANDKLKSALERTRDSFIEAIRGHRVRDLAETLAEIESALAAYEKVAGPPAGDPP